MMQASRAEGHADGANLLSLDHPVPGCTMQLAPFGKADAEEMIYADMDGSGECSCIRPIRSALEDEVMLPGNDELGHLDRQSPILDGAVRRKAEAVQ